MVTRHVHALVVLAGIVVGPRAAHASGEAQIWSALFAQGRLAPEGGPVGWFDAHARRRGDGMLTIVRPAVGYDVGGGLTAHAGYAWIALSPDEGARSSEHRSWQQLLWARAVSAATQIQLRPRLEQRFGAGDAIGHRARMFARGQWAPTPSNPVQLVLWNEAFIQLNTTDWGLRRGFDQNRLFAGVGTDTAVRGVRVEAGYLNVAFRADRRIDHAVTVNLFVRLAPRG